MHQAAEFILRTEHLCREIEGVTVVDDISLQISKGEILAIVGPSGSGKSSFLRLLNRLDEPTAGTVFYKGKDYREINPSFLRQKIGMVMQQANLFPGTVNENLAFGPAQRGEILAPEKLEDLLSSVRLEDYAQRDVATLSGGEAQRVSFARTLANLPEVLLLDEPTSSLDSDSQKNIEELILYSLNTHHLTAILVTHDLHQAHRMAHRILAMENGRFRDVQPEK